MKTYQNNNHKIGSLKPHISNKDGPTDTLTFDQISHGISAFDGWVRCLDFNILTLEVLESLEKMPLCCGKSMFCTNEVGFPLDSSKEIFSLFFLYGFGRMDSGLEYWKGQNKKIKGKKNDNIIGVLKVLNDNGIRICLHDKKNEHQDNKGDFEIDMIMEMR
ncbi:hypothetical protein C1645_743246 [Glomus cerebriforme]|uniref:Uncharacterized protein n=1 Tax=Glomus cerebriforme TaxID=658196 RepID=A0A397SEP3_9GLOM|nr:hypothetical protein C1645_743246 [Glomus cerebriforme]